MFRSTLILTSILLICLAKSMENIEEENQERRLSSPIETFEYQKAYQFYCQRTSISFVEAWRKCLDNGAQFATIESAAEDLLFTQGLSRIITVQAWIGATDLGQPGSFVWFESARPLVSSWNDFNVPWSAGQPATTGGACVYASLELNRQAKWRSVPCDSPGNGCYACQTVNNDKPLKS